MSSPSGLEIRPTTEAPRTTLVTSLQELFRCWRLDPALQRHYDRGLGIEHLYPWQSRCLADQGVAEGTRNLLYFAPTSGGKTMVAELLLLLRVMGLPSFQELARDQPQGRLVMEQQKGTAMESAARRAVFVLPFVSMVTEKVKHLQRVVAPYNRGRPKRKRIKVKALYGSKGGGGARGAQVAVCTIEKANALINRMAAANELHELSCLVVDELHMIGEGGRGQTLELLLSKVVRANRIAHHLKDRSDGPEEVAKDSTRGAAAALTVSRDGRSGSSEPLSPKKEDAVDQCGEGPGARRRQTQIIGMSATLSNGAELAVWLDAILHVSDYRPVPLDERVLLGIHVYDKSGIVVRRFSEPAHSETDPDHVVTLCRESCLARDQVIIFCSTKQFCHNCAIKVAKNLGVPASRAVAAERSALMAQLAKEMSMGVDPILQETIPHGVAFHHAGLADTERSAIEAAFRAGTLRVLAATSTLGAGVNLPAGRVILRNLNAPGGGLSATSYRQMAGRAGRKGSGKTRGEAIMVASNKGQATRATALMNAGLAAVKSALKPSSDGGAGLTKMVLEGVCCGLVKKKTELSEYVSCSLLFHQHQQQQCDGNNTDDVCENLLDHAFGALQLLIDEACVELLPQKRPTTAATATATGATVAVRPVIAARKTQLGAKPPLISPYSNFPSGLRRNQPSGGAATVSVARVSAVQAGGCAEGVVVDNNGRLVPTKLGMAIFRSSLGPAEGLMVYRDLSEAKHGINLRNTLRLAYLLTPICPPSGLKPNWERLHAIYSRAKNAAAAETLPPGGRSAALSLVDDFHKIGINEGHLHLWASRGPSGGTKQAPLLSPDYVQGVASAGRGVMTEGMTGGVSRGGGNRTGASAVQKAVRLVAAMALKDVSDGYNLGQVAKSYGMNKGDLQSLRQATATFSAMVASFLKELGWTMFLMIVKGYVPRLSLGVSNDLLPLMQVPGISRKEASALYQGGILNAKSLLAASQDKVATALRMNVPFRTRRGGGRGGREVEESIRFERRAQMLKNAAREMDAKRERGNKAQAMKLLKAVQGRLLKSEGDVKDLGGALGDLGGANDLICFAAAPKGCKRKRSASGGGSGSLGYTTGLSDGDSRDGSDSSSSSESSASDYEDVSDVEEDDMERAVEAMLAEERVAQEEGDSDSEEDGVASVDVAAAGEEAEAEAEREVVVGVIGSEMLRRETAGDGAVTEEEIDCGSLVNTSARSVHGVDYPGVAVEKFERSLGDGVSSAKGAREFHGGKATAGAGDWVIRNINKRRKTSEADRKPSRGTRDFPLPDLKPRHFGVGAGAYEASKATAAVDAAVKGSIREPSVPLGVCPVGVAAGGVMSGVGGATGAGWRKPRGCEPSPTTPISKIVPSASSSSCGGSGKAIQQGTPDNERISRVELRSSPSFLYEGDVSAIGLKPVPSPAAMVLSPQSEPSSPASAAAAAAVVGNGAGVRNVFGDRGGGATMAEFSFTWRRSRCFSFTLGGRGVDWVVDAGRKGSGMRLGCSYRRSWEALSSRVPLVPYTVLSAGESFVPMNRHENESAMRVVSGIAVSFDGVSSHYLALPPHLPGRPVEWHRLRHQHEEMADHHDKRLGFTIGWGALPKKAVEAVTHFVGFPWLCSDCSGQDSRHGCARHSARKNASGEGSGRRCKPWNQTLLVSRRWNAIGVEAINRLAAEEPSGRWRLVRDVMEDVVSTKICLDMKGALVCLRSLGIDVRGPLEDPEVARWLVEPVVDEVTPQQPHDMSRKKRKTPLSAPPRAPRESLSLDRQPKGFVELWGMQAAATLALMSRRERDLKNLGLTLAFHLIEMPAVRAAAMMEYCGLALKSVAVSDMRRDLELKLRDLEGVADQLAGDRETAGDKTALASPKRIHDILYAAMGVKPPPSWRSSGGGEGHLAAPPPRVSGASKRVSLGPTDTTSLQELLEGSGKEALAEDARGFIRAVIQYRALTPASRSLGGLLLARRWHPHLGGVRVNPRVDLFTTTGRMIASEPPLQNLEHKIRLKRSWRLSVEEEMEADLPDVEGLPRVWAEGRGSGLGGESPRQQQGAPEVEGEVSGSTQGSKTRESLRVIVANNGESAGISFGEIVGIVEDRFLNDPIYRFTSVSGKDGGVPGDDVGGAESMASFWQKRGYPYSPWEACKTRQVLVRLGGGSARVYSYPADKVFRLRASFLSDSKAESLMATSRLGADSCPESVSESVSRHPWFGEEALLRPRAGLVPSVGHVFVSADYSQIEMRLMAHLSGDPHLLGVFSEGGDVFRGIAAALKGGAKQASHITDDERRQTKVVVYGVLYGQSAEALAPQLGVSRPRAWKIRQTVLKTYPKLRDYLQRVKDDCKKNGFVETLLGRRRYLPYINSADAKERARAERQAANTVCQGSAADLLKLAATNVAARLEKCEWMFQSGDSPRNASEWQYETPCRFPEASERSRAELVRNPACRLVLSIHDELLYEVLEPHANEVAKVVKSCMEGACSLLVPLVAHPRIGKTWASMADVEATG